MKHSELLGYGAVFWILKFGLRGHWYCCLKRLHRVISSSWILSIFQNFEGSESLSEVINNW